MTRAIDDYFVGARVVERNWFRVFQSVVLVFAGDELREAGRSVLLELFERSVGRRRWEFLHDETGFGFLWWLGCDSKKMKHAVKIPICVPHLATCSATLSPPVSANSELNATPWLPDR